MDAPCARACGCSCMEVYFKLILPAHNVSIVLQGFIPTTTGPRLNFNQLLNAITAMVWIPMKLIPRAHTWTIQAAAGLSSVLAWRQEQVTCGCGGEQRHSCQTEMTAALPPQHRVRGIGGVMKPGERCEHWRRRGRRGHMLSKSKPDNQILLFHYRNLM